MSNILQEIVNHKKDEVELRKISRPLSDFILEVEKSDRSLHRALSNQHSDFILECKKASPSKGLIRQNFNQELGDILQQYSEYASAISVLTDRKYFQGDFSFLAKASKQVNCPVLCKDFFIDEYQVYEARYFGADAILLMLSVLDDSQYKLLAATANELNLDILTEVHSEKELQRAIVLDAKIIGINNRNLKDLSIDLATTEKLASSIPQDRIIISESGIKTHRDIKRLAPLVNGFLIGSSIMEKNDIRSQCKKLLYGNIKVCGITRVQDAKNVDRNGGLYAGLIFHKPSKRNISLESALEICNTVPMRYVGVFVNENIIKVIEYAIKLNLHAIQLHGSESDEYISLLREKLPEIEIWQAQKISNSVNFNQNHQVDRYLLDTYSPQSAGGTGESFDWNLLDGIESSELILAGGICVSNMQQALSKETYALDLSSGVELEPGIKCPQKINQLFKQLRA